MLQKLLFCFAILYCFVFQTLSWAEDSKAPGAQVTLSINNETFGSVVETVYKLTGYTVLYDESWSQMPVSGDFKDTPVDLFFSTLLSSVNRTIILNREDKQVIIYFFDNKSTQKTGRSSTITNKKADSAEDVTGMFAKQVRELEEWRNDPFSIDPLTGRFLSEIRNNYVDQLEELDRWKKDSSSVDPSTGRFLGEVIQEYRQQVEDLNQWRKDSESLDPVTGRSLAEIRKEYSEQVNRLASQKKAR